MKSNVRKGVSFLMWFVCEAVKTPIVAMSLGSRCAFQSHLLWILFKDKIKLISLTKLVFKCVWFTVLYQDKLWRIRWLHQNPTGGKQFEPCQVWFYNPYCILPLYILRFIQRYLKQKTPPNCKPLNIYLSCFKNGYFFKWGDMKNALKAK